MFKTINFLFIFIIFTYFKNQVHSGILVPPYFNLVTNKNIDASATCGEGINEPELFCKLTGATATDREILDHVKLIQGQYCDYCDPRDPTKSYPARHAIDGTERWWQSPPISRSRDYNKVNLTIAFGQEFHVAYVYIKMGNSPRPGVWVLERSTDYGKTFTPWQYFADTPIDCLEFFKTPSNKRIEKDDQIICTTEYSKVVPLEGAEIVVSLINNRPSSLNFTNSDVLQKWTRATNVRLRLIRTKTLLGHLMAVAQEDPSVTRRYFYSIRDISIGGRCVCNGHAQDCEPADDDESRLVCNCQHNTCGDQCQECCPGFVQKKWRQNRENNEFQCESCQCYGHSDSCHYDEEVEKNKQSIDIHGNFAGGGVCDNCQENTEGINCEKCKKGFYRPFNVPINATDACRRCECHNQYSTGNCAEGTGQCECKKQYTGRTCDKCAEGYIDWPYCRPCDCHVDGRADNTCVGSCVCKMGYLGPFCDKCMERYHGFPNCRTCDCEMYGSLDLNCDAVTGHCICKPGYTGPRCDQCNAGYFMDGICKACDCDAGTTEEVCHKNNGTCICRPNYTGPRCDECAPGFYNFPACLPCECNMGGSKGDNCSFHGNVKQCFCVQGRGGPACDQCAPGYYQYPDCLECQCDEAGTIGQSCDPKTGKCKCKPNFVGEKCSECAANLYNYPICEECKCHPDGVVSDFPGCSKLPSTVTCPCKEYVGGRQCDQCKDRYYGLGSSETHGCSPCDCSKDGSNNELDVCDQQTGQCFCKTFAGLLTCSECTPGTYQLERNQVYGCEPCDCRVGSSLDNNCNKDSGACTCLPHIIGNKCDFPDSEYYIPSLHSLKFEIEDGYIPSGKPVRYGFDPEIFKDYSWKGYVNFNKLQNFVSQNIKLGKSGSYRMILKYINKNSNLTDIFVRARKVDSLEDEQNVTMYLPSTHNPEHATVTRNQINAVTFELEKDISYQISFKSSSDGVLLDYFVLLPSDFYEPSLLKKNVENICQSYNEEACVQYQYPPLEGFFTKVLSDDPNYETLRRDLESVKRFNHTFKKPTYVVPIDSNKFLELDIKFITPGKYVLLIDYLNLDKDGQDVNLKIEHSDNKRTQLGKVFLYKCNITTFCRQVVVADNVNEPLTVDGLDTAMISMDSITDKIEALIYRVIVVPKDRFNLNYIKMSPKCIVKNGRCIPMEYVQFPQLVKMELESDNIDERHDLTTSLRGVKQLVHSDPSIKLVYLHDYYTEINVPVRVSRREGGEHLMIVHYYQPNHPVVNVNVSIDQSYRGSFQATHCPSISGCRAIVKFGTTEIFNHEDARYINFQNINNGRDIWLDYVLFAPAAYVKPDSLKHAPIDMTDEFLTKCASQHFYIEPNASPYCDEAVFALSAKYNNGALPCNCNADGSINGECDAFGGQCRCRENVIGRKCDQCKTGYYGFPDCKQCSCPSGNCDDSGKCICPPNVEEDNCSKCVPGTYGFDPHFGCDDCDCIYDGTANANQICNAENGQCDCKPNIDGRRCDMCKPGYYGYPECNQCSCNVSGTTAQICDSSYANCLCKEHVGGPSCDHCNYGSFNLDTKNPKGCTKCFCFGFTEHCISSHYYFQTISDLNESAWKVTNIANPKIEKSENGGLRIEINGDSTIERPSDAVYWIAPELYTGRKLYSYGGSIRYGLTFTAAPSQDSKVQQFIRSDIVIKGNNMTIVHSSLRQPSSGELFENTVDLVESQFSFASSGFTVSRDQLMHILNSVTEIRVRASYVQNLESAELLKFEMDDGIDGYELEDLSRPALSVERCNCPVNNRGLSCESCAPGFYKQKNAAGTSFTCVPCNCNGRSETCDEETGECLECEENTSGRNCEKCKPGYYGVTYGDNGLICRLCPCPGPSSNNIFATGCMFDSNANKVYHCSCLEGYTGQYCERCAPGYYGDPVTPGGKCLPCECNKNIDMRDFNSCDQRTGACLKCLNNTAGLNCERCADWHYGDALVLKNCKPCTCDKCGSSECSKETGECVCKPEVKGLSCNSCPENMWGFNQCDGCKSCNCNPIGSISTQCNTQNGNCLCKPGVGGKFCDMCLPDHWNFTENGCEPCNCDKYGIPTGLSGISCNQKTGDCHCIPGVKGKYCDECDDRWILVKHVGCKECDTCVHTLLDDADELFIKADEIENRNSSLTFKAHNKLLKLENEYNTLKDSIAPETYDNTGLAMIAKNIKKIKDEIPDIYGMTQFVDIENSKNTFQKLGADAEEFTKNVDKLRDKLNKLIQLIEFLKTNQNDPNQQQITDETLKYYTEIVDQIKMKKIDDTYKEIQNILSEYDKENARVMELESKYKARSNQADTIKNKTMYIQKSLDELKIYIDKAKNTEPFKSRDVTFKAYIDDLNRIRSDTNTLKETTQSNLKSVKDLINNANDALANSNAELQELDKSVEDLNKLYMDHDDKVKMLNEKHLEAEAKATELARTAKEWQDRVARSQSGLQAFEAAKIYDSIADAFNSALENSKETLEKFMKANETLGEYLQEVAKLNEKNNQISKSIDDETKSKMESENEYHNLNRQHKELDSSLEKLAKEVEKIDQWVAKTQSNDQQLNTLKNDLDNQQKMFQSSEEKANDYIFKVQTFDSLKLTVNQSSETADLSVNTNKRIDELNEANEQMKNEIESITKSNKDCENELDKIEDLIYDLRLLIDSTRDIANEINVAVKFNESSSIRLRNSPDFAPSMVTTGSLYFKTMQSHAPIAVLYNESNPQSYMSLYLNDGKPHLQFKLSDTSQPTTVKIDQQFNDNEWHKLEFERIGRNIKLEVKSNNREPAVSQVDSNDDHVTFKLTPSGTRFILGQLSFPSNIVPRELGPALVHNGVFNTQFKGAIDSVRLNGQKFGLWNYETAENIKGEVKRDFDKEPTQVSNQEPIRFNEGSFMCMKTRRKHRVFAKSSEGLEINILFKTAMANGLIWFSKDESRFIAIYLQDGYVNVEIKPSKLEKFRLNTKSNDESKKFNNNKFRELFVRIKPTSSDGTSFLSVLVQETIRDEIDSNQKVTLGEKDFETEAKAMTLTEQCLGGLPTTYKQTSEFRDELKDVPSFVGCVEKLYIRALDPQQSSLQQLLIQPNTTVSGVDSICPSVIDQCSFNPPSEKNNVDPAYVNFDVDSTEYRATLGISFQPKSSSGTLLFIRQQELQENMAINYIHLYMEENKIILSVKNTNKMLRLESPVPVGYHELHHVYIIKEDENFSLIVNDVKTSDQLAEKSRIFTNSGLFVGGIPQSERGGLNDVTFYNFRGCVIDVIFNGKSLKFQDASSRSQNHLLFSKCYKPSNQVYTPKTAKGIVQHLSQEIKVTKNEACLLSKNFDESIAKPVGLRFGLTRQSRLEVFDNYVIKQNTFISFKFRTLLREGMIFYASDALYNDYLAVWLQDGRVNLAYDCGSGRTHLQTDSDYSDGRYHTVIVKREKQIGSLQILDKANSTLQEMKESVASGTDEKLMVNEPYYIGSLPQDILLNLPEAQRDLISVEPYIGCMSDFIIAYRALKNRVQKIDVMNCANNHESGVFFTGKHPTSFASLPQYISMKDTFEIDFDMKPRVKDGVILYIGPKEVTNKDYAILEMVNGELHYRVLIGGMNNSIKYIPKFVNNELCNGNWIEMKIKKDNRGRITMNIKNGDFSPNFNPEMISLSSKYHTLHLGALPNADLYPKISVTKEPFVGCIRDLVIKSGTLTKPHKALLDLNLEADVLNYCPLK